jgi:hypothetical protein
MAHGEYRVPEHGPILDTNGEPLYEKECKSVLFGILRRNDVATLHCYIEQYPLADLAEGETSYHDSFYVAAEHGSTDTLCVLFDLYEAEPTHTQGLSDKGRGFSLLNTACLGGNFETVRFLLDRDSRLGRPMLGIVTEARRWCSQQSWNEYPCTGPLVVPAALMNPSFLKRSFLPA